MTPSIPQPAWRDAAVGLSLANLCFITAWDEVLTVNHNSYLRDISATSLVAVPLAVLLVAAAFTAAFTLVRRSGNPRARWVAQAAFLVVALVPLMQVFPDLRLTRVVTFFSRALDAPEHTIRGSELNPLFPLLAFGLWPARSVRVMRAVVVFLLPLTLITFGRAAWRLAASGASVTAANADGPLAPPVVRAVAPGSPRARVIVLLFDEMDYRLAFAERPAELALPELDRLRGEALFASQAMPPGARTEVSVPALLAGRPVSSNRRHGPDSLLLTFGGPGPRDSVSWADAPNLFDRARALGVNAGVVGWYHPYCRVFAAHFTRCFSRPHADAILRARGRGLAGQVWDLVRGLSPLSDRARHIADYRRVLAAARAAVTDTSLGLLFVHLPVPHNPVIYDGDDRALTVGNFDVNGYYDNLELADATLGILRREMEAAGLWDGAILVLTSDHPRRAGERDPRVPFLVKLAGRRRAGRVYRAPFSTIALHDLTLGLLKGEIRDADRVAQVLDRW